MVTCASVHHWKYISTTILAHPSRLAAGNITLFVSLFFNKSVGDNERDTVCEG